MPSSFHGLFGMYHLIFLRVPVSLLQGGGRNIDIPTLHLKFRYLLSPQPAGSKLKGYELEVGVFCPCTLCPGPFTPLNGKVLLHNQTPAGWFFFG